MVLSSDANFCTHLLVDESLIINVIGYRQIRQGKSAVFLGPAAYRGEYIYNGGYMYAVGFVENTGERHTLCLHLYLSTIR
jgi:hypothetical protein